MKRFGHFNRSSAKALASRAVLAWDGIGDADGTAIGPSPDTIDELLDVWPIFETFQLTYLSTGLLLEQEKNVSALSPNGVARSWLGAPYHDQASLRAVGASSSGDGVQPCRGIAVSLVVERRDAAGCERSHRQSIVLIP
ncbi:MAG TPA: hypothetical protein PLX43_01145 [Nitrobacter sp.]|nr:hypothetical protein [Nitrobacter sp.]